MKRLHCHFSGYWKCYKQFKHKKASSVYLLMKSDKDYNCAVYSAKPKSSLFVRKYYKDVAKIRNAVGSKRITTIQYIKSSFNMI